jgi:SAM-dependent methyltransferase
MTLQSNEVSKLLESWYATEAGQAIIASVDECLQPILELTFGYHAVQLGPVPGTSLMTGSRIRNKFTASASAAGSPAVICADDQLPFETDSVDLLIAWHSLEFSDSPHASLREMHRTLAPHGHLLLIGFNPISLQGSLRWLRSRLRRPLWRGHQPVSAPRLTDWLRLVGCEVEQVHHLCPLPVVGGESMRRAFRRGNGWLNRRPLPFGNLFVAHAIKQVPGFHQPVLPARRRPRLIGLSVPKPAATPKALPLSADTRRGNDVA